MAYGEKPPQPKDLVPRISLTEFEQDDAKLRLQHLTSDKPLVALHPYATHPAKQWPRNHWLTLTGLLASAGMDWIVVGRDKEPLIPNHEYDLTNKTDLRETCALLGQADILVTADSGPCIWREEWTRQSSPCSAPRPKSGDSIRLAAKTGCWKGRRLPPCSLHGGKTA